MTIQLPQTQFPKSQSYVKQIQTTSAQVFISDHQPLTGCFIFFLIKQIYLLNNNANPQLQSQKAALLTIMNQISSLAETIVNQPCQRHPHYQTLFVCVAKHACRLKNMACSECIDSLRRDQIHQLVSTKTFSKMKRAYASSVFEQERRMTELAKQWRIQVNRDLQEIENLIIERFRNKTQIQYYDFSNLASNPIWSEMKKTNKTDEDFEKTAQLHHTQIVSEGVNFFEEISQKLKQMLGKIGKKGKIQNAKIDSGSVKFEALEKQEEREQSEQVSGSERIEAQESNSQNVESKNLQQKHNVDEQNELYEEIEDSVPKKKQEQGIENSNKPKQHQLSKKKKPIKKTTNKLLRRERSTRSRKAKSKPLKKLKKKRSDRLIRNVILKMGKGRFYDEQLADEYNISMPTLRKWQQMYLGEVETKLQCKQLGMGPQKQK